MGAFFIVPSNTNRLLKKFVYRLVKNISEARRLSDTFINACLKQALAYESFSAAC